MAVLAIVIETAESRGGGTYGPGRIEAPGRDTAGESGAAPSTAGQEG